MKRSFARLKRRNNFVKRRFEIRKYPKAEITLQTI